ncbi:MAG: RNA polymerase sigma factor [Deltaproteobacteria bacterium]|nr:RNA polymerase sigma factor [Deltaproteobacteria bacterium]
MDAHLLLARHGPRLYGLCRALDPDPDDAYQEVWEKAFRALPSFDPHGPATLSTWLHVVAHNHLIDRHRKARVRRVEPLAHDPAAEPECDPVVQTEEVARLRAAVAALPDDQRRAVVFHYLDEIPVSEVAAREGVPVGTVKSRLHTGRARLLQWLGGQR